MKHCKRQGCTNPAEAYGFCGFACEKYDRETVLEQDGFRLVQEVNSVIWKIYRGNTLEYSGSNEKRARDVFKMIIEAYRK